MNLRKCTLRTALFAVVPFLGASLASAQIELIGSISDDTTGPLLSGQVYHLSGGVSVPVGKTLTMQAGTIVKGRLGSQLFAQGTLLVNGTPGNEVVMTSILDDVGGDTNLDGPTAGVPGDWRGVYLYPSAAASSVSNLDLRYGGNAGYAGVECTASGVTFDSVTISACSADALGVNSKVISVVGCNFTGNGGVAMQSVPLQSVPLFSGNTATGNAGGNYARVVSFTHNADLSISTDNCIDGVLVLSLNSVNVASGWRLTLNQGLVVKSGPGSTHLLTQGTLDVLGTAMEPVVFTTLDDDSVGGDTANDGLTSGVPGSWRGLFYYPSASASRLEHAEIKFAGNAGYSPVTLSNSAIAIADCWIHDNVSGGIDFGGGSVGATVINTSIQDNVGLPIRSVPLQAVPFLSNNTASGNTDGDYIQSTSFSHTSDFGIELDNVLNDQLVFTGGGISVAVGRRLTIGEGLIFKMSGAAHFLVQGQLEVAGTPGAPVIFTPVEDDAYGGDTQKDGATSGTPGSWRGLYFYPTSVASTVDFAILRYTGNANYGGISMSTDGISITNSIVEHGSADALNQINGGGGAVVAGCSFLDNAGLAASNISVNSLVHFRDNIAMGNAAGNYTQVTNLSPVGDVVLKQENVIGDLIYIHNGTTVSGGNSLTFEEGMILKVRAGNHLLVNAGGLHFLGTAEAPITLTSFWDDSVVGDSDLGAGPPAAPGDWRGVYIYPGAQFTARHLRMSYVGNASYPGFYVSSPAAVLDHVEVRHATVNGFDILTDLATDPTHLTAFNCAGRGIHLRSGSCTVRRSTVVGSGAEGILRLPAFSGRVADTVSYGNVLANYSGFGPGALRYCNGSPTHAGTKGNVDTDPLFVDESGGDLNLQVTSPCVDAGNPQSMTDPDGSRADMGSYYFDFSGPTPYCGSKLNSLGCLPAIDWTGDPTLGGSDDFHVTATNIVGQQPGYLLSSLSFNSGAKNGLGASLFGTHLCAYNPKVVVTMNSGGTAGTCNGTLDAHYSQALMASEGLLVGQTVYTQYVYKDPAHPDGSGWGHTNALRFQIAP